MSTFSLSVATAEDHPTYARLFRELGVPEDPPALDVFTNRFLPRIVMLRDASGVVLGYSAWNVFGPTFHVGNIVTAPEARRRGVGQALLEDLRVRARAAGCVRWFLNVKQDNAVAIRLYERCGFAIEQEGWTLLVTWAALHALPGPPQAPPVYTPTPEEVRTIAARFDLNAGRVERFREHPDVVVLALAGSEPLGIAVFDPSFPGVFPIRVAAPELARTFFDAFRPSAKHDHVRVFIERDRALSDALRAAGASLEFALYGMSGAL